MKTLNFEDYRKYAKNGDCIPALKEMLKDVTDDTVLKFEKGEYHFKSDEADKVLQDFPYHNYGLMDGAFHFKNMKNITVDGGGSTFYFRGRMLPFMFDHCENVTLRNLAEDYERAWYTQFEVVDSNENYTDLAVDRAKYPLRVENKVIYFDIGPYELDSRNMLFGIEFSPKTGSLAYGHNYFFLSPDENASVNDSMLVNNGVEELENGLIRFHIRTNTSFNKGNILAIQHCDRGSTGVSFHTCKNVTVEDFNLYHCAGMGISLNSCTNTLIQRVNVVPAPGSGRLVSIMADAIHCINAMGSMEVLDCVFESMNDDAANFHGFYVFAKEKINKKTLSCIAYHNSRTGVEAGDRLRFVERKTLKPYEEILTVEKAEYPEDNREALILTFKEDIPDYVKPEMALENRTKIPSRLHVKGLRCGKNRPRGLLISVACPTLIENCEFYNSDTALDFTGDANYWYESGPAEDVEIRNNIFRDCTHASFCAAISFRPVIPEGHVRYHSGVKIHDNLFESFNPFLLEACHVSDLEFYDNKYVSKTDVYKPVDKPHFKFVDADISRLEF